MQSPDISEITKELEKVNFLIRQITERENVIRIWLLKYKKLRKKFIKV